MKTITAAAFAALTFAFAAFAADVPLPKDVKKVTSVEGITEYNLANGLRVLFAPDASKPTTTVNTTYLVGSKHENYGETGMAHLLEHLLFKGTPKYPLAWSEFTRRGLRANGTTWTDRTNYFASFAASDENLDWYLRWSADAMVNSFIARKDLDSEMTVVRNEMERAENSPVNVLLTRTLETAYSWHNYGKSTIGARADVENVNIERLQAFYRTYYQPDNAVLIVAGKFDEAKTLALIAQVFGSIPRPTRKLQPAYTLDPEQQGERSVTVRRIGDIQVALAMYHVPAGPHPDFAAVHLLATILGDATTSRLKESLVDTKQAAQVFSAAFAWREPSPLLFAAMVPVAASLDTARATLLATVEGIASRPITDAEVERARTKYLSNFELNASDPERIGIALSGDIALGDWRLFFLQRDQVRAVKSADIQRVAAAYLLQDNRTLGLFVPTATPKRPPAPQLVDVAPLVKDYKGDAAVVAGEAFDATPANIDTRTQRFKLAEGANVALTPKRTRGGAVQMRIALRYGDEKSLQGTWPTGQLAMPLVNRGAAGMTRTQIQDAFDKAKARVNFSGSESRGTVTVETTRDNLPAVLALVGKLLRSPEFPATELDLLRSERITQVESQRKEPEAVGSDALARHGNPYPVGDPRRANGFDETIAGLKAVTVERVRAFHRDFFGANAMDIAVVGDFDPAAMRAQLAEVFGGWKSARPWTRLPMPLYTPAPTEIRLETPDKANAFFLARARFPLRDDAPDYAAMLIADRIVGGGTGSILWKRIREKDGTSYGVGASTSVDAVETSANWTAFAIYAPQNVKKLEDAFREELARVKNDGFTAKELEDAKNGVLQARKLALAQDAALAFQLTSQLELGRTMEQWAKVDRDIAAVTLEQANAAFRKYVDPSKLVTIYAGDFAKAK